MSASGQLTELYAFVFNTSCLQRRPSWLKLHGNASWEVNLTIASCSGMCPLVHDILLTDTHSSRNMIPLPSGCNLKFVFKTDCEHEPGKCLLEENLRAKSFKNTEFIIFTLVSVSATAARQRLTRLCTSSGPGSHSEQLWGPGVVPGAQRTRSHAADAPSEKRARRGEPGLSSAELLAKSVFAIIYGSCKENWLQTSRFVPRSLN